MKNSTLVVLSFLLAGAFWCDPPTLSAQTEKSRESEPVSSESSSDSNGFAYWSQYSFHLKTWDKLTIDFHAEGRMTDDISRLSETYVGPQLTYRAHSNIWLGLAYKRIEVEGVNNIDGRFEFDLYPRARLSDRWSFDSRHRLELIHREDRSDQSVFRHQLRWTRELGANPVFDDKASRWTHLMFSNEFFHEDRGSQGKVDYLVENQFIPLAARRRLSNSSTLDLFAMLRSTRDGEGEWNHNYVFGTSWSLSP